MVHITIDVPLTSEQFDACLSVNGFPAQKQMYDENNQPLYVKVPLLDMSGDPMLDENDDPIMVNSSTPVTEPFTAEEWSEYLVKQIMFMPFVRQTTWALQEAYWKNNYSAKEMNEYVETNTTVTVVIE